MANNTDGTVALNNYLQMRHNTSSLSWEDKTSGPRHAVEWTSTCKMDGAVIASGTGSTKNVARDAAAKQALAILMAADEPVASAE